MDINQIIKLVIFIILLYFLYSIIISKKQENFNSVDYKIILFFTGGLCEEALNCIQSIDNIGLKDKLLVNTLDSKSFKCVKNKNINVNQVQTNVKEEANFGTKDFYNIVYHKFDIIKNALVKSKSIVVYSDTDIVFLNNIQDDINKFYESNYDIMIQDDSKNFNISRNLCTGFIFFKPVKKNIDLCNRILKNMKISMKDLKNSKNGLADQKHFNKLLKEININVGILDLKKYPNGSRYFKNKDTIYKNYQPNIIHNNFIVGTKKKIERFKKYNLWFI